MPEVVRILKKNRVIRIIPISRDQWEEGVVIENSAEVLPFPDPGRRLKARRESQGWTLKQVSGTCGISPAHLSEMEAGKRLIGKISALGLTEALRRDYK